ncbi:MAG: type II secretion system F family protein [Puniceicoccales bacterium]|jgi:type IV pilus assembly protein PilC|nr:type II secretion system F family protein [Puniceicoccales bacterium]
MKLRDLVRDRALESFNGAKNLFSAPGDGHDSHEVDQVVCGANTLFADLETLATVKPSDQAKNFEPEMAWQRDATESDFKKSEAGGSLKIGMEKKVQIFRKISILLASGTDLRSSLSLMIGQESKNRPIRIFLRNLLLKIESGSSLSEAMMASKAKFHRAEIAMLKAGESIGALAETMERMANLMDKKVRVKKKILSAMLYPATVMLVASVVVIVLTSFVIPKFEKIIEDQIGPRAMPTLTSIIIGTSRWISFRWKEIFMALVLAIILIFSLKRLEFIKKTFYGFFLKIPLIGSTMICWNILVFTRTFGDLLICGLAVVEAMKLSSAGMGNFLMQEQLDLAVKDVQQGMGLADSIRRRKIFPPLIEGLIKVGEESGKLGEMMNRVADNCEDEIDETITRLSSILEPVLVIVLALFVGTIIIGLFMPLVSLIHGILP